MEELRSLDVVDPPVPFMPVDFTNSSFDTELHVAVPTYIYKIVLSSTPPPVPLPERLPVSELDETSGYLHFSTSVQIPEILELFFADAEKVYIFRVEYKNVENDVKWQKPNGGRCFDSDVMYSKLRSWCIAIGGVGETNVYPHLYNGLRIGCAEIESIAEWEQDSKGWDTAVRKAKSWLIY